MFHKNVLSVRMKKSSNRSNQRFRFYARMVDVRIQLCKSDSYSGDLSSGYIIKLLKMLGNCLAEYQSNSSFKSWSLHLPRCTQSLFTIVCIGNCSCEPVKLQSVLMKAVKTYFVIYKQNCQYCTSHSET